MKLQRLAAEAARHTASVFRRFPWVGLIALAGTACSLAALRGGVYEVIWERLLLAAAVALPLAFGLALRGERSASPPVRRWSAGIAVVLGVVYALWLATRPEPLPQVETARFLVLLVFTHLVAAVLPWWRRPGELGFWRFNEILFLRFLLASLYTGVLYGGLSLALLSVERLLGLDLASRVYGYLWCLHAGVFHPLFFLGGVPRDLAELDRDQPPPDPLRKFVQFVLVPLTGVYLVILYLYGLRILLAFELPNGWVGLPVLLLGVAGILAVLLLRPWALRPEHAWARRFSRGFFVLTLPLTALLALSIGRRIADYGVTEERYLVVLLTAWLAAMAITYAWRPRTSIRVLPWSLAVLALLAAWGGPIGASGWSRRSQQRRVAELLQRGGLIGADGQVRPFAGGEAAGAFPADSLASALRYLHRHHGEAAVAAWFPAEVSDLDQFLVFLALPPNALGASTWWHLSTADRRLELPWPGQVFWFNLHHPNGRAEAMGGWTIRLDGSGLILRSPDGAEGRCPLEGWPVSSGDRSDLAAAAMTFEVTVGSDSVRLLVINASGESEGGRRRIGSLNGLLAVPTLSETAADPTPEP